MLGAVKSSYKNKNTDLDAMQLHNDYEAKCFFRNNLHKEPLQLRTGASLQECINVGEVDCLHSKHKQL
jgi:hypothetical protein